MKTEREREKVLLDFGGTANVWRQAAYNLGFKVIHGSLAGQGNMSLFLREIAAGEVPIVRVEEALAEARLTVGLCRAETEKE